MDDALSVDDIVTGKVAEQLGHGRIPTRAVLIVETMSDEGTGLRFVLSEGLMRWQAMGMIRSVLVKVEHDDLETWDDD